MGNSSSAKNRHVSGEDVPSLGSSRFDTGTGFKFSAEAEYFDPAINPTQPRRARASTITPGQEPTEAAANRLLPTVFKWEGGGKDVYLSGSFNSWKSKIPLAKSHGDFYTILDLPEGEHQYKFYVDGQWVHAPNEPLTNSDIGTQNNLVRVKRSDFDAFEALAIDSKSAGKKADQSSNEYGQDIPVRRTDGKHSGPPFLPPQLLQVLLNKDTPAHVEPSLLPEPNHVMLNHLYALSIKSQLLSNFLKLRTSLLTKEIVNNVKKFLDGVMVLSATHRFRKKYVTTLLYKPIQ